MPNRAPPVAPPFAPILVFEMTWTGTVHAPGNGATLQTIARAFPNHPIHVFADRLHLAELRANPALAGNPRVRFHEITVSRHYQTRTAVVSLRRLAHEAATLWRGWRHVRPANGCLMMLLSATSTAVVAASVFARLSRRVRVQIGLHGNLNEISGWRSRNPVKRALDLTAALAANHDGKLRFLVLETSIKTELAHRFSATIAHTDVLPLPINSVEMGSTANDGAMPVEQGREIWPPVPLRIGFVGQATIAKGVDIFLALARDLQHRLGGRVAFDLIGRALPGTDMTQFGFLANPPTTAHLTRAAFIARLQAQHYVMLPLRPGYYDLATSGALIDALTWLKPVIATRVGFVADMFAAGGDIGYLCETASALTETVEQLIASPDVARYARQVEALRALRAQRTPDALAANYRSIITTHFPGVLT